MNRIKGALGSFIRRVEAGDIAKGSYLLVDSMDRFSRESETQVLNMLTTLTLRGIKVVNLADDHVLDHSATMIDYVKVLIHASRSKQESDEKSRKVRLARAEERAEARRSLKASTPIGPFWLKSVGPKGSRKWVVLPDRLAVVERIFALKEAGLGNATITKTFNRDGVKTPKPPRKKAGEPRGTSGRWFNTTVADIASSRAVLGEYQPFTGHPLGARRQPDGEAIVGFYPAIIDEARFNRVQAIIGSRRNPNAKPATKAFRNLLIGICHCEECGGVVGFGLSTFPRRPEWRPKGFLRCNAVARGLCDNRTRIPTETLEAELLPYVARLKLAQPAPNADALARLMEAEGERLALLGKIDHLLGMGEAGRSVVDRLRQRDDELVVLDRRINTLRSNLAQDRDATPIADVVDEIAGLTNQMETADGDELYAIRARIHVGLKQVVRAGFTLSEGHIKARFKPDREDGKPLFYWSAPGGLIRWQTDPAMPDAAQMGEGISAT